MMTRETRSLAGSSCCARAGKASDAASTPKTTRPRTPFRSRIAHPCYAGQDRKSDRCSPRKDRGVSLGFPRDPMRLHFDGWVFDRPTRQLLRGGGAVHLSPKAFDLLGL